MRVLVVGSGGREHALVRALNRSPQSPEVYCSPGNPGMWRDARQLPSGDDLQGLVANAREARIDLVIVGPEAPLIDGLADHLAEAGIACFGPSADAAKLEGSKAFAKELMLVAGVPTAHHKVVWTLEQGMAVIESYPVVLKADGLAAGKGVVIAHDADMAREALDAMLVQRRFGTHPVLIEEYLTGDELSVLAICDGERALPLVPARDFKRLGDRDSGPNTGGMGSFSPVPGVDADFVSQICETVHQPILDELRNRGTPLIGVLYAGLMMTSSGPMVLEFNVRFGDPEAQAILPRLRSDILELFLAATRTGELSQITLDWDTSSAVTVVLAARGYPVEPVTGDVITGVEEAANSAEITQAGTALRDGALVTNGGRVLNVTATASDLNAARAAAYAACEVIEFEGKQMRRDIALAAAEATL